MKKFFFFALMVIAFIFSGCQNKNNDNTAEESNLPASDVYFTENITPEGVMQLFEYDQV